MAFYELAVTEAAETFDKGRRPSCLSAEEEQETLKKRLRFEWGNRLIESHGASRFFQEQECSYLVRQVCNLGATSQPPGKERRALVA